MAGCSWCWPEKQFAQVPLNNSVIDVLLSNFLKWMLFVLIFPLWLSIILAIVHIVQHYWILQHTRRQFLIDYRASRQYTDTTLIGLGHSAADKCFWPWGWLSEWRLDLQKLELTFHRRQLNGHFVARHRTVDNWKSKSKIPNPPKPKTIFHQRLQCH